MKHALESVSPQLERLLADQDYGTAVDAAGFLASIADAPVGLSLASVFAQLGEEIPPAVDLYRRFSVWLIPIRVGIIRRRGKAEVTSVGVECEFHNEGRTCCVVALFPTAQFVVWGGAKGEMQFSANLSMAGELLPGREIAHAAGLPSFSIAQRGDVGVAAAFSMNVITPYISAVGVGSQRVEWRFDRHDEALFGRDLECWAVTILPKDQDTLAMRVRMYMTTRTVFFPTRRESEWQDVVCQLPLGGVAPPKKATPRRKVVSRPPKPAPPA
jgi:hypothetical protein